MLFLSAKIKININYQVEESKIKDTFTKFNDESKLIKNGFTPKIQLAIQSTFGQFPALKIVQERLKFNDQLKNNLQLIVNDIGVNIISVELEDIEFLPENCCNLIQK